MNRLISVMAVSMSWCLLLWPDEAESATRRMFDVRSPMRDGVDLSTDIWLPKAQGKYPLIFMRTPYGKVYERWSELAGFFAGHGYAFAVQDVRGRNASAGEFGFFQQEAADGYDAVEWLAEQPWSDGRICMMGASYLGTVQWLAASQRPPHLACIATTGPGGDFMNEVPYIGGAFRQEWSLDWLSLRTDRVGKLLPEDWADVFDHRPLLTADEVMGRKERLYREWLQHPTADDYWEKAFLTERDFRAIDVPALYITGWFDSQLTGTLYYWQGMARFSPAAEHQFLLIGPWTHGLTSNNAARRLGELEFTPGSDVDSRRLHLEFFDKYLKQSVAKFDHARSRIYLTGKNEWRDLGKYPLESSKPHKLYLSGDGNAKSLAGGGRLVEKSTAGDQPDQYEFDPKNPVPLSTSLQRGMHGAAYGMDRRSLQRRNDILVYAGNVLEAPLDVIGPVAVDLFAASDGRDTDFTASLVDIYPDGRSVLLGSKLTGIVRARYRNNKGTEELLTPGKVEKYTIDLGHVGHSFGRGHRIGVEISSSAAPRYNPNQNTGNPIATDTQWRTARQTIYHDARRPSALILSVAP